MKRSTKVVLVIIVAALIPAIIKLQAAIDPQRAQFQPGRGPASVITQVGNNPVVLPSQYVIGTIIGFREAVAGLLWIRADDFFHSGNYDAIIPIVRMGTWMDPHQVDIYGVGAWHLAYNFVDYSGRADWRYISPALKFLEEGIQNNPSVWDLYVDMGFVLYYMKILDFDKAVHWVRMAERLGAPYHISRQVAHLYEKAGRLDDAERQWHKCIAAARKRLKTHPDDDRAKLHLDVSKRNLNSFLIRRVMREDLGNNPVDVKFDAKFERIGPRVFRISGHANLPDVARIHVTLMDADYKEPELKTFTWEVDPNATAIVDIGLHGISVRGGKFERKYDLTKDPKQYPLKAEDYVLTLVFNPRAAPISVQDRVGWSGEGITDKRYLDTSVKGVHSIKKVILLKREDIV